ncbi:MAG: hypothetical protein LBC81_06160 [Tannerellaceae bacterium]|jgi:hypothetical protein|nr:hypothetical protein [Tannerellaceae bacterium]
MKTSGNLLFAGLALALATSCMDTHTLEADMNVPVYLDYETMRAPLATSQARELKNPGKICFKDNYLFIVEAKEGIHVIDVSNPASPRNITFIESPGCNDIAIRNQSLYTEHYVDLVVFDVSDVNSVKQTARLENIFPYSIPPIKDPALAYDYIDAQKGIVVDWEVKRVKREKLQVNYGGGGYYETSPPAQSAPDKDFSVGEGSSSGKTGSMARFGIYKNYLYLMSDFQLKVLDLDASKANIIVSDHIGGYETMFIHDGHIFFGAPNGMFIYSLEVPARPIYVSGYSHLTSCDPVVVQDSVAYVTMRGGTTCRGTINQLDVVQLSDNYRKTELLASYPMFNPYGLGVDGNTLFVCDGDEGLKVYDVADKKNISLNMLAQFRNINAYDVIPAGNFLFMIGSDGFYLYDYKDPKDIKLMGKIPVVKD